MSLLEVPAPAPMPFQWRSIGADGAILALWKLGHDTLDIADKLWLSEGQVAARLAWLRDRGAR